jgi:hypothetical protein
MKVRISKIKEEYNDVRVTNFNWSKKNPDETDEEFMDRMTINHPLHSKEGEKWNNVSVYRDIDDSDLPEERASRDQWFPDFEENGEPMVKVDTDWSVKLMKPHIIKQDIIKSQKEIIDEELEKGLPDIVVLTKAQRRIEKVKGMVDQELFQEALNELDKRVANGKSDKVEIRAKLESKLRESNG